MRDGPRRFPQDFSCPAVLRYPLRVRLVFAYVAITLSGRSFQTASANQRIGNSTVAGPTTPSTARDAREEGTGDREQIARFVCSLFPIPYSLAPRAALGLGCSDFARRYFRNHYCFLFLQVLRWFTSLGSLSPPMNSAANSRCSTGRVAPFGHPRISACLRLPGAYRSLLRPSSPACAKASTVRP